MMVFVKVAGEVMHQGCFPTSGRGREYSESAALDEVLKLVEDFLAVRVEIRRFWRPGKYRVFQAEECLCVVTHCRHLLFGCRVGVFCSWPSSR